MSLKVWLPFINDLKNIGNSEISYITSPSSSFDNKGKIGDCLKIVSQTELKYIPDFNNKSLSFGGWFKFNKNEISSIIQNLSYSSTASTPTGNLLGNTSYGGIGLVWTGNNYYSSNTFSSLYIFATLRTSSVNNSTSSISVDFDTWIHIMCTWNVQKHILSLYKNGILINSKNFNTFSDGVSRELFLNYNAVYGGNGPRTSIPFYCNDIRIYDHCLSPLEVKQISQGLILHYKLNNIKIQKGINLVTGVTKGGQTTLLTDGRIGVQTSGTNADTYFTINLSENIVNGNKYFLNCDASGISEGQYWSFPLGAQGNSTLPFKIYNGHNEYWFTANDINWGTNRLFMDDNGRADWVNQACFYNFQLVKIETNTELKIEDSSGYNHNGKIYHYDINGFIELVKDTPRYDICTYINSENNTTNTASGTVYIYGDCKLTNPTQMTIAFWCKPIAGYGGGTTQGQFCTTNIAFGNNAGSDYQDSAMNHRDGAVDINDSASSTQCRPTINFIVNEWHHYVFTYNGKDAKSYRDGVLQDTKSFSESKSLDSFIGVIIGFSKAGGVWRSNKSYYSDFRVYCTALNQNDIKKLYNVNMSVDNFNNIHTFELDEILGQNKITKTGIFKNYMVEPYLTLKDGSKWKLMLYHYVDNGNNLFTSSNASYCNDIGLYSRLKDINNYTYNGIYEFYVLQDDKQFRWTQTSAPTASSIAGKTVVQGYNDPVNGLAKGTTSNTYIGYDAWWGACGCWVSYSLSGKKGIPGFGSHNVNGLCLNYLALYVRVNDNNFKIENSINYVNQLIEK